MKKPLVSFIIPIYNVAPYVEKCITSILDQSFGDFEIIAVNDGSTDNCGAILEALRTKDPRVRVIHKKNGGLCSARNAGIVAAEGIWTYFLDGDDSLLPDSVAKLIPYLDDRYDLVMSYVDENLDTDGVRVTISNDLELAKELDTCGWDIFSVVGKFYRTEIIQKNGLRFDEKMIGNEDQAFELVWLGTTSRLLVADTQTYDYLIREDSISHSTRDPRLEMGAYAYYCQYLDKNPSILTHSSVFCGMFIGYAVYKILEGLSLDFKAADMRKIMDNPLVIQALSNTSFVQKDKALVSNCIRKKAVMSLILLFNLKNMARKVMPLFNCVKKRIR